MPLTLPFWPTKAPYQAITQDEEERETLIVDPESLTPSPSLSTFPAQSNEKQQTHSSESWFDRALLGVAAVNVLVALGTLILTRDLSSLRFPLTAVDVASLPRPDPFVGLNLCKRCSGRPEARLLMSSLQKIAVLL